MALEGRAIICSGTGTGEAASIPAAALHGAGLWPRDQGSDHTDEEEQAAALRDPPCLHLK